MRTISRCASLFLLTAFACAGALYAGSADEAYKDAMKALSTKDYSTALSRLETAVSADPDNVRYASDYRQAIISSKQYDRCVSFFEQLAASHPQSANAFLNFGFAYVDKLPDAGSITQVILANNALKYFSKSVELHPTWIGYYTRGNSYLYWPKVFNRTSMAVADLEAAMKIQNAEPKRPYHARTYVALGDAYWKMDDLAKAQQVWKQGLALFPDNMALKMRLTSQGDELKVVEDEAYDFTKRVDTNLKDLWANQ